MFVKLHGSLSTYCVLGTVVDAGDTAKNKLIWMHYLTEVIFQ